ncbi:MAG: T9SS type A sorting domain-containing protein [Candidatus Cloacimonadota bacterium]|nr:T9SS type A sorting domain-containing protein [Candidatus Cloacimonadota bacterium]
MKKLALAIFVVCVLQLSAVVINIPDDQPTIQAGLNIAAENDTVLVHPGVYFENLVWPATSEIKLFGINQEECIIDGNNLGNVIRINNISGITKIDGFTIQNGNANGTGPYYSNGGGIYCVDVTLQLSNLFIVDNTALEKGGGIYCRTSDLSLINILISNNISNIDEWCEGGGGIYCCVQSNLYLDNVSLENNTAVSSGGGLFCKGTTLNIHNSEFINNHSLYDPGFPNQFGGGGMFCYSGSSFVENVTFSNNTAISNGGGFGLNFSDAFMNKVYVTDNSALASGGGVYMTQSISELTNLLVTNNSTEGSGGGLSINGTWSEYPLLTNVTIANNCSIMGGGICAMLGGPRLTNCILWNNEPEEIYGIDHSNGSPVIAITYSDIEGGEAGINFGNGTVYWMIGNIDDDPLFLGMGDHPYSLNFDSPCIDAGTLSFVPGYELPGYDIVGNTRIFGTTVDMGAYEWQETLINNEELVIRNYDLSNYPNPFNPSTIIEFSIQNDSKIELLIFNIKGQKIKTLANNEFNKGDHSVIWYGNDDSEKFVSSGVYFYKLNVNGKTEAMKKCLLLK